MNKLILLLVFAGILLLSSIFFSINVVAVDCWSYNSSSTCTSLIGCNWRNDSWSLTGWCEELNCWSLGDQAGCASTVVPGKNCTWQGGGTTYSCERMSCYSLSGTNESSCTNNTQGLSCEWSGSCYNSGASPGTDCWSISNQSTCSNTTACSWGQCMEKGCWSYSSNETCNAAKDWNGKNCTWNNNYCEQNGCWRYYNQTECNNTALSAGLTCSWRYNSCQETDCYTWDFTNSSTCLNNTINLSCSWTGSYCQRQDCWSYNTQAGCELKSECLWKSYATSGGCQEVQCWTWDSMNSGNQSLCESNSYGQSCLWSGNPAGNLTNGWCYKDSTTVGCSNKTTERDCMDTMYCWWQYIDWNTPSSGGTCNSPGGFGGGTSNETSIMNDWNPGCYIFDMNSTDCNNIIGCNYTGGNCISLDNDLGANITDSGLNCSYINSSSLCNSLPILSSCCIWQNGTCITNKMSSSCRDQITPPPAGASFCEDYNSYENQDLCEQIAGSPWYMPCDWSNSTSKCAFKAGDVFGNDSYSLSKIDNKRNCEAAGGKWITENYCEGNVSVPAGRCEYKFNEEDNCDKACFACEIKDSSGNSINSSNAASACGGSKSGICEFEVNTNSPNGIGYCKSKSQFKSGVAGNCDSNCGDCTFKGDPNNNDTTKKPSYFCTNSKANSNGGGCKWVVDNSTTQGGYCINKGEKTCEDSCDRCKTQTNCANIGRTAISNQTGSCMWQGTTTSGSCTSNTGQTSEICWDGIDNNDDNLVDCADPGCYADSSCGFVSGDCFGWSDNSSCVDHDCEWVTDKWGSWCDFKGSQCWRYNQNNSICNTQTNCLWSNGTGNDWCEQDWSISEVCMGLNQENCMVANASGCNWTVDSWCLGQGNATEWCSSGGGWCDHESFKPKNCWSYQASSSECNNHTGCNWRIDEYSQPMCDTNMSAACWLYNDNDGCSSAGCYWKDDSWGQYCTNIMDRCWGASDSSSCAAITSNSVNICYWQSSGSSGGFCQSLCFNGTYVNSQDLCSSILGCVWRQEAGWCEETAMQTCSNTTNWNDETNCESTEGCRWKNAGWCDPKNGGFSTAAIAGGGGVGGAMGGDCYKYDGNQTLCTNKTIINISCGWTANSNPRCDVNFGTDCWQYDSVDAGCNLTNNCWFKNDSWGSYCTNIMDQCWQNQSLQTDAELCNANLYCNNNSWGGCEPACFSLNSTSCINATYLGKCKYADGWCNPKSMNDMFTGMESGMPAPLGQDTCGESEMQASVDICGFGIKDMGDSYGFGVNVNNFENSSVCYKEKLSSFVMGSIGGMVGGSGQERTGDGNETVIILVYLDTDGSTTGGCALSHDSSAVGYEFRFKYSSVWNSNISKAVETFNGYECEESGWKAADIQLSAWKKKMCSDVGGPMVAVKKSDLGKFPVLYDSTADMRIYVATIGNTGNTTTPTDSAGPGWTTPGSVDFDIQNAFAYGADSAKFEDILRKGFVQGEDCFNSIDDNGDGNIDCNDWDCQYSSQCSGIGVNAAGYSDTSSPLVTGVKIEEYPDSVLIMYDTNKPTNGTLELYGYGDTQCLNKTNDIYDVGIFNSNVRNYKTWHTAVIYETNETMNGLNVSINWPLVAGSTYNYKLKVCDSGGKCSISKCSSFKTAQSLQKCSYCNFVTRIKVPTGWKVSYDVDKNGIYEHVQGEVCGPNAGMKANYTLGRKVNIKLEKSDGSTYIEFLNASLTKTGLNDKVRTISTSGDIIGDSSKVGLTSETKDKIINNLHPEVCRIKIPNSGTCNNLYHCDDNGENCVDRTTAAGGAPIDSVNCVWNVPNCEFSTYKTNTAAAASTSSPGGSGSPGGGGGISMFSPSDAEFIKGYTKELARYDKFRVNITSYHYITLSALSNTMATFNITSKSQIAELEIGELRNIDVTEDGQVDFSIKLNGINSTSNKANVTVKKIVIESSSGVTGEIVKGDEEKENPAASAGWINGKKILFLLGLVVVIFVVLIIVFKFKFKRFFKRTKGLMLIDGNFISMLNEAVKGKDYKGKWIDLS